MTDFILEIEKKSYTQTEKYRIIEWENKCQGFDKIINYAKFLKQPLKLEMFVPCDEDGEILDEPKDYEQGLPNMMTEYNDEIYRYKQAKEKVLFEGIELISETDETWLFKINGNFPRIVGKKLTIESLRIFKDKIKLSQSALNAIFG